MYKPQDAASAEAGGGGADFTDILQKFCIFATKKTKHRFYRNLPRESQGSRRELQGTGKHGLARSPAQAPSPALATSPRGARWHRVRSVPRAGCSEQMPHTRQDPARGFLFAVREDTEKHFFGECLYRNCPRQR